MADVSFSDIEQEFLDRVKSTVWCTFATVDRHNRPRSRILHPIWETSDGAGPTGWILTGRNTLKTKHIAHNAHVSLTYWDPNHKQVYADCRAEWVDDIPEKQRIWDLYKNTPPPLGYDPGIIWQGGKEDATYGLLKLTPWRIELYGLSNVMTGAESQVWRA